MNWTGMELAVTKAPDTSGGRSSASVELMSMPRMRRVVRRTHRPCDRRFFSRPEWSRLARRMALSRREIQIVQFIFDDRKESSIAGELEISCHTVHTHLERLYRKLDVRSRAGVVIRVLSEFLALRLQSV